MAKKYVLLFFLFSVALKAICQHSSVSLKTAIGQLEKKHSVTFSYADDLAERLQVSFEADASLKEQLADISNQTGLAFSEAGKGAYLITLASHHFCAQIVNSGTAMPMEGAQIILNNNLTNIISDENGYAKFDGKLTFQDTVSIQYFGFDTKKITAGSLLGDKCPRVELTFGETTLREIVITSYITSGIDFSNEDHSFIINTNDLSLLPGETDGDILLAIKTLPGISSPNGKAGNLHTRGSTTDQTLVLFDNIPIYHKGHYFGTISPYNPIAVDQVEVYRSGYGPDLGGRVGGAIKLESRKSVPDSARFGVGINTYYGSAFFEVPVSKKLGVSGSVRSTYNGEWQSPKLEALNELALQNSIMNRAEENIDMEVLNSSFTFYDLNFSSNYKLKEGNISMSFLAIDNLQEGSVLNKTRNSVQGLDNSLKNNGVNTDWSQYWSPKFNTTVSATYSDYEVRLLITQNPANNPAYIPNLFEQRIKDFYVNAEGNILLNQERNSNLNLGYQVNRHAIDGFVYSNRPNRPEVSIDTHNEAYLHSFFINHQTTLFRKLTVNSGIRNNYYTPLEYFRVEPRLFLNWKLKNNFSVKSSYGLYSQYITQYVYFDFEDSKIENLTWELASNERPVIKSTQWMLGSIWRPGNFVLDFEFYHKNIFDLSTLKSDKRPTDPDRSAIGDLEVYGVDVLLKKKWNKLDTWISYSYAYTDMYFQDLNLLSFETYYDQPHTLNINATLPYKNWSFSIGWQYQSGVPFYTNNTFFPVPGEGGNQQPDQPVTAQKNEGRFPVQHQLDLAVVYKFPKRVKSWNGSIGLSLLNAYDRENFVAENYLTFGPNTSLEQQYAIGFAPNIMLNIRW
ncbi:TonB-dependent receptor plug domain-containing protein [Fulvivirga ulvae]|uniref:TonB-dependent receptor plug domain-containing protein n=1 Tax=Fulvivirga ulvae TaxID=2904245 RepID=UPI001F37737E|nr:TonB-dependent receptor plug domain-containing protein [Fulvivirga ulvae]UII33452.1 TonB-dependent receptor plug domain-containing protein [Fulvivirga ulvae]